MKDHGQNHPGVVSRDGEGAVIRGHVPVCKSQYHFLGEFGKSILKLLNIYIPVDLAMAPIRIGGNAMRMQPREAT